jgi:hypothetical protein
MVAISMHLLNKQDEIKISIILDGGGVVLCMNNTSNVSREGMAYGENLW